MNVVAALVRSVLERADAFEWTVQGFGMLRTKLADAGRIHVWDSRLRVPLVSDVHAHPWDLTSTIISGELINQRFKVFGELRGMRYIMSKIATGEGGGLTGTPKHVGLESEPLEFYKAGDVYAQAAEEVHRSIPIDGCVTLLARLQGPPLQETTVYWPQGARWVSAEPRPATPFEIKDAVELALSRWSA